MAGRQITFEIEVDEQGNATIRLPEGRGKERDAAIVDDLTLKIAKAMGTIKERHVGDHDHHHTDGTHTHTHKHLEA